MDIPDEEALPVPPPCMFECGECAGLLRSLAEKIKADAGCFTEQLAVAAHIAAAHPEDVPAPHTRGCDQCPTYAKRPEDAQLWAEHRARELFLPEAVARLL